MKSTTNSGLQTLAKTKRICQAGLGFNWLWPYQLQAKLFSASSMGKASTLTESGDNTIGWFEISKGF